MSHLTKAERRAIKRLQDLALTWPKSLQVVSSSGTLHIVKESKEEPPEGRAEMWEDVANLGQAIPNDGGDPDWTTLPNGKHVMLI